MIKAGDTGVVIGEVALDHRLRARPRREALVAHDGEALFRLLVAIAMFQRRQDKQITAILRSMTTDEAAELSSLGDVGVALPVTVFDDGRHEHPSVHADPFRGWLLFTAGVLLRNDTGHAPADWDAVVSEDAVDAGRYDALVERRLLPLLCFASDRASEGGRHAIVTVPGVGCGQFAGQFAGTMGEHLERALRRLLERHANRLAGLRAVYLDPYRECDDGRYEIGAISLLVRPLTKHEGAPPQLCRPERYADLGDDFAGCMLFSVVAWDHVSWPGNDFWVGSRSTDDGVKAAATDTMFVMTGVAGRYDVATNAYQPPKPYGVWREVVEERGLAMSVRGRLRVLPRAGG